MEGFLVISEFWVYENWRADGHKAKVHQSLCGHCSMGLKESSGENDKWHGPFLKLDDALQAANQTGANVTTCLKCIGKYR